MDPSVAPIILLALTAGIVATAIELRAAMVPASCPECPHCRTAALDRQRAEDDRRRREQELDNWSVRRTGVDRDEDERRLN
jgi:hypothetical protein